MKCTDFKIIKNHQLTSDVYEITLKGDTSDIKAPGQFVNIKLDGLFLRRPISVCDLTDDTLTLIYKVVGKGTEQIAKMNPNEALNLMCGLGNGFNINAPCKNPLLIGGGVGVPPLYWLAKEFIKTGKKPLVILGFNTKENVFYEEEFNKLGVKTIVTTVDGSYGIKGYVTDALNEVEFYDYFYSCGPEPMLKALYNTIKTDGQLSFEERMACGFGVCMGCSCKTLYGNKRICKDGPVLNKNEVIWQV
ncbi:dihydroorotate dehydrogenase electron transfer subunit [Eubacteriales bacterium OttesenSCG-928-G02]|nr:dihydroorotate dehydrogenase electron transfer subunit [Eubacteriales bacterium OttesenSCG-928-G02]